jgi:hypothetical protein
LLGGWHSAAQLPVVDGNAAALVCLADALQLLLAAAFSVGLTLVQVEKQPEARKLSCSLAWTMDSTDKPGNDCPA